MQTGFYFDQSRCTECFTCCVACKDWHDIPAGPAHWRRVVGIEEGKFPDLFVSFLSISCLHCADPVCVSVCPAKAITKRDEDGVVVVEKDKCQEEARCGILSRESIPLFAGERESSCKIACPAHLSVQGYIALIASGRYKEALDLMRERVPLPAVLGRVCKAPCEAECRRKDVDEPLGIASLHKFVSDYVADDTPAPVPQTKKERIAIIGSGPAGLGAAYDLVRMGYGVTIFEALPVAGGMLAAGIPGYRLPKGILQKDLDYIKGLGVEIKVNSPIGDGLSLDDLFHQGYDAIFIAIGAHQSQKLPIPGADTGGVLLGTSFLRDINLGKEVRVGKKVVVLGGGDVAIDCARSAWRLAAEEVHIAFPESREKMPAEPDQVKMAEEEGIIIHPSLTFSKILGNQEGVTGVECLRLSRMEFDEEGGLHVDVIPGSEHVLAADTVIWATGQAPDTTFLSGVAGIEVSKRGNIVVDPETFQTDRPGIFAGGDAIGQGASVIDAVASGQKAAVYIDRYLKGEVLRDNRRARPLKASDIRVEISPDIEKLERQKVPRLSIANRSGNFREVSFGFSESQAIAEAKRCLICAGRVCREVCPYQAPQFRAGYDAKMEMCNFCLDRLLENKKPACVDACPMRALDTGPLDELRAKYGDMREGAGFLYSEESRPSVVFKPRKAPSFERNR